MVTAKFDIFKADIFADESGISREEAAAECLPEEGLTIRFESTSDPLHDKAVVSGPDIRTVVSFIAAFMGVVPDAVGSDDEDADIVIEWAE